MEFRLQRHAYVHVGQNGAIWLDVRKNKYAGQTSQTIRGLEKFIEGWPVTSEASDFDAARNTCESLESSGLLTRSVEGKTAAPVQLLPAQFTLVSDGSPAPIRPAHVLCALWSFATIRIGRRRSFEYLLDRVARRKRAKDTAFRAHDWQKARSLTAIFLKLRPYLYDSAQECLWDSLICAEFLAWFALYPKLVIGVQEAPFGAHCWVQQDQTVFNDQVTRVQRYTPILAL